MRVKDVLMLLLLAALWGGSFLFIRIGAPALGPVALIELRVLLAGLSLVLFAAARRQPIHILHRWRRYLALGTVNAAVPFTLISLAELRLDAGFAAILNATTPMFTALVSWLWIKDPLTVKKLCGVVLGVFGVTMLVGWGPGGHGPHLWLSATFSLLAALFYAVGGVLSSRFFQGEKPVDMAIGQQMGASVVLLPFCLAALPRAMPSPIVIFSVLGLAIACTAVAYLFFFALIQSVGPLKTLTVTFLVPVFGVIWSGVFLGERITMQLLLGLFIILSSVALLANVRFTRSRATDSATLKP